MRKLTKYAVGAAGKCLDLNMVLMPLYYVIFWYKLHNPGDTFVASHSVHRPVQDAAGKPIAFPGVISDFLFTLCFFEPRRRKLLATSCELRAASNFRCAFEFILFSRKLLCLCESILSMWFKKKSCR